MSRKTEHREQTHASKTAPTALLSASFERFGQASTERLSSTLTHFVTLSADFALIMYSAGFICFRNGELVPLAAFYPSQFLGIIGAALLAILKVGCRHIIFAVMFASLIFLMDNLIPTAPQLCDRTPTDKEGACQPITGTSETVVITGANSGIGLAAAEALVQMGATVIMGCRSECSAAADRVNDSAGRKSDASRSGRAIPILIDLADFDSVSAFVTAIKDMDLHVDVLFNNAGYPPPAGLSVNKYGLDPGFTAMHLSHFLLTELLLADNPSLRIVNTSSGVHHLCAIPFAALPSFLLRRFVFYQPGCVDEHFMKHGLRSETDEAAYIQAKVANIMHARELPRRHPGATALAVDLGWVGTSIMPFMTDLLVSPTQLGWMRSTEAGTLPVLNAILSPATTYLANGEPGDENETVEKKAKGGGLVVNVFGGIEEPFSYFWWTSNGFSGHDVGSRRLEFLAGQLWDVSKDILQANGYLRHMS